MRPPSSVHEDTITCLLRRDGGAVATDEVLTRIADDMRAAREVAEALAAGVLAVLQDAGMPEAERVAEARRLTAQHAETAATRLDTARACVKAELSVLDDLMAPPMPNNATEVQLAAQIRMAMRGMPPAQRDFAIQDAIDSSDHIVLVAALGGAAAQIGMTDGDRGLHLTEWRQRRFPAEMERHARLEQAAASIETAGAAMVAWVGRLNSNPRGAVAEAAMD